MQTESLFNVLLVGGKRKKGEQLSGCNFDPAVGSPLSTFTPVCPTARAAWHWGMGFYFTCDIRNLNCM